jgi:hypothetical protein
MSVQVGGNVEMTHGDVVYDVGDGPSNEIDGSAVDPPPMAATTGCSVPVAEGDHTLAILPFSIASSDCSVDL